MVNAIENPIISPTLIGRTEQVEYIRRQLVETQGGQGRVVLVTGEAGVGKTRLVREARQLALEQSFTILQGNCFESEKELPYAPLLDLLRLFFTQRPAEDGIDPGSWALELAGLLPEVALWLPVKPPVRKFDPEQKKHRIFHTIEGFIHALANQKPLLLVVEDIHWSDDTSLDFLLHLIQRLETLPLLLILTYRSEEQNGSLDAFLARIDRTRLAHELPLSPLSMGEVDAMLQAIFNLSRPVSTEFLQAIYDLTEGNPFFIEEVIQSLLSSGDIFYQKGGWDRNPIEQLQIPRSVQVAVRQRAERVDSTARQILILAAVAGKRFDFDLIQELTGIEEQALLAHLKTLVEAQLIVEESADHFAFRHAMTREAVYTTLLVRERQKYHRLVAEKLKRLIAGHLDDRVSELAYHYYQARVWEKALEFSWRAGEKAQSMYAPREAAKWFQRAVEASSQLSPRTPARLYLARGHAYETMGEFELARLDYEQALEASKAAGERESEWKGLINLGFLWVAKDYEKAGDYFHRAFTLAQTLGDDAILAHSLNRLGNWCMNVEQTNRAKQYHLDALALYEKVQDRQGLAETFDLLGMTNSIQGNSFEGLHAYEQAVSLFRELDDRYGLASSLGIMGFLCSNPFLDAVSAAAITLPQGIRISAEALEISRQIGWRAGEALAMIGIGVCNTGMGSYGLAFEYMLEGSEIAAEIDHSQWKVFASIGLGLVYRDLEALPISRRYLEQALALAEEINSPYWVQHASGHLAAVLARMNEFDRAETLLDNALDPNDPLGTISQRSCCYGRLELALARGEAAQAVETGQRLMSAVFDGLSQPQQVWQSAPRLLLLYGQALMESKRFPGAEDYLNSALKAAEGQEAHNLIWRIRIARGKLYRARRLFEAAEREFSAARTLIEELHQAIPDADISENFLKLALAKLPRTRSSSKRWAVKQVYGGLTEREREIAGLVGLGWTNREIANSLIISSRTVERHISNILNKLGFESRAQIIAWSQEKGMAKAPEK